MELQISNRVKEGLKETYKSAAEDSAPPVWNEAVGDLGDLLKVFSSQADEFGGDFGRLWQAHTAEPIGEVSTITGKPPPTFEEKAKFGWALGKFQEEQVNFLGRVATAPKRAYTGEMKPEEMGGEALGFALMSLGGGGPGGGGGVANIGIKDALKQYSRNFRHLVKNIPEQFKHLKELRETQYAGISDPQARGLIYDGLAIPSTKAAKGHLATLQQLPQSVLDPVRSVGAVMEPEGPLGTYNRASNEMRLNVHPNKSFRPESTVIHEGAHATTYEELRKVLEGGVDVTDPKRNLILHIGARANRKEPYSPTEAWPSEPRIGFGNFYKQDPIEEIARGMENLADYAKEGQLGKRGKEGLPRIRFTEENWNWMHDKLLAAEGERLKGDELLQQIERRTHPDLNQDVEVELPSVYRKKLEKELEKEISNFVEKYKDLHNEVENWSGPDSPVRAGYEPAMTPGQKRKRYLEIWEEGQKKNLLNIP